jgi:hypothetical protein
MNQPWHCEKCGTTGEVPLDDHADVWSGARIILAEHSRKSPRCYGGVDSIRVEAAPALAVLQAARPHE